MKKIIIKKEKKEKKERKNMIISEKINNHKIQNEIIQNIYFNYDFNEKKYVLSELKKKINGYKSQDIKKKRFNIDTFIKYDELVEKLLLSKLKCKYCFSNLLLIYDKCKEPKQWTLDRIDNNLQHTNINTLVCCLECNLKRRRINKDKFLFTKQMKIVKSF